MVRESFEEESSHQEKTNSLALVLSLVGFALLITWLYVSCYSSVLLPAGYEDNGFDENARLALLLSLALSLILFKVFHRFFQTRLGLIVLIVLVLLFASLSSLIALDPSTASATTVGLFWILSGLGHTALMMLWSPLIASFGSRKAFVFSSSVTILSGLLFCLISYMQPVPAIVATGLLPLLSLVLATAAIIMCWHDVPMFLHRQFTAREPTAPSKTQEAAPSGVSRQTVRTWLSGRSWSLDMALALRFGFLAFVYSIGMGFAGYYIAWAVARDFSVVSAGLAIMLASLIMLFLFFKIKRFSFQKIADWLLPLTALGLFPMILQNDMLRFISALFLVALYTACGAVNTGLMVEITATRENGPIGTFSMGRFGNALGFFVGWVVAVMAFNSASNEASLLTCVILLIMIVFIVGKTFIFDEAGRIIDSFVESDGHEVVIQPSAGHKRTGDGEDDPSARRKALSIKCEQVAMRYGLSARQREVLVLLAKGRNAEYIEKKFVISNHTAKAHIYNIYKKLGIHSQQDLIDLVEHAGADKRK
jgi:DNA-binding CsgD family transcriptional regulator